MWQAAEAETAATDLPSACVARQHDRHLARLVIIEARPQAQLVGGDVEQGLCGPIEYTFAGTIDEPDPPLPVEGEHGHVDLGHDPAEQGGRLAGVEALVPHGAHEGVRFEHDLAQGIPVACAACAKRGVTLAQAGQEVRQGLQREYDGAPDGESASQPAQAHHD